MGRPLFWPRPFSDPQFWPKNGKSTLCRICLNKVSFPMFIGTRNRLQLFVLHGNNKRKWHFGRTNWNDLDDFQVSRYPKIVTASYINIISASENALECYYSTVPTHFWALYRFLALSRLQVVQMTFYFFKNASNFQIKSRY